jgi:peroxiredoxin
MRKSIAALVLTTLLAGGIAATFAGAPVPPIAPGAPAAPAAPAKAKVGELAPAFSVQDSNGKTVNLSDYKGKIVVLEWINLDCPIDRRVVESKLISTVHEKFKDKVVWLAVDSTASHTKADYDKVIAAWKLTYPVLADAKGTLGKLYDAKTTPHMYIINTDGKLVYSGAIDDDPDGGKATKVNYVDKALTELLAGKTVSVSESKPYGCTVKYAN